MKTVSLLDVAELVGDRVTPFDGRRQYVATGDLDDNGHANPTLVTYEDRPSRADVQVRAGDVCMARMRNTKKVRSFAKGEEDFILSTGFAVLRPSAALDSAYLRRWLDTSALQSAKDRLCTGAIQPAITNRGIGELTIPLPPIEEQQRIAAVLDAADALRAKRREALAKLDTLTQAIFVNMFGGGARPPVNPGPVGDTHPGGWHWVELRSVATMATGHTPDRGSAEYWGGDVGWVNLNEIRRLDAQWCHQTELTITPAGVANSSAVILPIGTVCFSRTASIGFVTILSTPMATSQDFINWMCHDELRPDYLMWAFLMSREVLRASSSGSTHRTIYVRDAQRFHVLLPPVELQREFERRLGALRATRESMRRSAPSLDELFVSLQQRAFRGDL